MYVSTFTGRKVGVIRPRPEDISINDIAHALSLQCRFNGHTIGFYSVAQHCVLASQLVDERYALHALLHDASEAYLSDVVSPVKRQLSDYQRIEIVFMDAISKRFGLTWSLAAQDAVKWADLRMLATEKQQTLSDRVAFFESWPCLRYVDPFEISIKPWEPREAEKRFLRRFRELTSNRKEKDMAFVSYASFHCPKCDKIRPIEGRKRWKWTGKRTSHGRKIYNYICADCYKKEEK